MMRLAPATSSLHRTTGNHRLGLALSGATVGLWGVLGIAIKLLLVEGMDGYTVTWYRMIASTLVLGAYQWRQGRLPALSTLPASSWRLLAMALAGLLSNYVLFAVSLNYVPPATAQLVIQLAPILLLAGSLVIFREGFSGTQGVGVALLVGGLLLFFNDRLGDLIRLSGSEAVGVAMVVASAILWATYALSQKQLLTTLSSPNILLLIYVAATVLLLPLATPSQIAMLDGFGLVLLAFCIFNTIAAYGAFAEALAHWEASRVSAVISLTPLVTILAVYVILAIWPDATVGTRLDPLGLVGAVCIVGGSMLTALWRQARVVAPVDLE